MEQNILHGNISKQLLALACPLLLGDILQQLYNTVDAVIIGRYVGPEAFAAVGIAGAVMHLLLFVLSGFCAGISIVLAQLYGAGDSARFRREVYLACVLGGGGTLLCSGAALSVLEPLLRWIETPERLLSPALDYLSIIAAGMVAVYFYNAGASLLRAIGNCNVALYFLAASVLLNTLLDFLFVGYLRTGVAGAAWATVIAQAVSAALCFFYVKKRFPALLFGWEDCRLDRALTRQTLHYGFVAALQKSSLYFSKVLMQSIVNSLGFHAIAAYAATTRVEGFANAFGSSACQALSVFVAQNTGAGNDARAHQGLCSALRLLAVLTLVMSAAMFWGAELSLRALLGSSDPRAVAAGVEYLQIIALFYALDFAGEALVGYFNGSGKVNLPLLGIHLHISLRIALSYCLVDTLGFAAIAWATGIGWVSIVALLLFAQLRASRQKSPRAAICTQEPEL